MLQKSSVCMASAHAAVLFLMFAFHSPAAIAGSTDRLVSELPHRSAGCVSAPGDGAEAGARCLVGAGLNLLLDEGMGLVRGYGEKAFGHRFRVAGNPGFSPDSGGIRLTGDVDVVVPFAGGETSSFDRPAGSALSLQQGASRWRDASGSLRNDLRTGLVYRFRLPGRVDGDILGLSLLRLHSPAHRHEVLVSGVDYAGRWGSGSFRYFRPVTGWQPYSLGQEERALAGMELEARFDLTTTLRVTAAGHRRDSRDSPGQWTDGARLGFGWRPHPWLRLDADHGRTGGEVETWSLRLGFRMPLGGDSRKSRPVRWAGLGVAAEGSAPEDSVLWRPVEGVGRIRTATRAGASEAIAGAQVRFLGDTVESGDTVRLEIVLASAASEDILVEARLVPGSGSNPAVPGVDFVDTPVTATIPRGAASVAVSFRLLLNENLEGDRSLGATVTLIE